jgi:peptidoglycan-N-acetylglucosamine deacetylase
MKAKTRIILLTIFLTSMIKGYSVSVDTLYKVCVWKGNTEAAVTYTFDDNLGNQYSIAIPMFNQFGFHATFYPVINWSPNWTSFQTAANNGHEIGSHTVSHANLGSISDALQNVELKNSLDGINSHITGHKCLTIAYPYCAPGKDTITSKYYIAARHCQGNIEKTTPTNFYAISSIVCGNQGSVKTTVDFKNRVTSAAASKGWVVYLIHALDGESGYSPLSSTVLRESLEYLDYKRDKFWVATFVNAVQYIRERNCASVEELEANADTIKVQITDTLADDIYNCPITIHRQLPEGWEYAAAFQNGSFVETTIKEIDTVKYIEFNAVPDGGVVTITVAEIPPVVPVVVDQPYEVGTWKGFTKAAVTYTFDDNCSNQYNKVIPMFNEFRFNATFFPVIDWSPNWTAFQNAADLGHEIGSHTVSHDTLGNISDSLQNVELKNSYESINTNITGQICRTIAYPFCSPSDDTITSKYYIAARNCQGNIEKTTPDDFFNISSIACGAAGTIDSTHEFYNTVKLASGSNGWVVYMIQGVDGDGGSSDLLSSQLRGSLEYLDANRDTLWVSTFVNVSRYIRERNAVSLNVLEVYADSIHIEITDTLDNEIYNYPVSFRRTLLSGWVYAKATQNGNPIESRVRTIGSKTYIEFNVIPDGGTVSILKAALPVSSLDNLKKRPDIKVMPNPFSDELVIQAEGQFYYYIHSLDGRLMEHGSFFSSEKVGGNLIPGIYILNVQNATEYFTTEIIKSLTN